MFAQEDEVDTELAIASESEADEIEEAEETLPDQTGADEIEEAEETLPDQTGADEIEEAEEIPPDQAPVDDGRAWYVVHCYSGREQKLKHNLEQRIESLGMQDKIFQVVIPTEDEMEVRQGKRRTVERRIFPGYVLVQMIMDDDSWYAVRETSGVTGFVGMGNKPTPLRPAEIDSIMARMESEAPKIKVTFKKGEKVRIIDGPFDEFIGVVDEIDMERAQVRVLVSFFGRETPVELDFLQVERT